MAKQDSRRLTSLAAWGARHLETEDGRRLGRVFDLRVRYASESDETPVVTHIVYGARGLLERLGLRRATPSAIRWSSVVEVREDVVIVRR